MEMEKYSVTITTALEYLTTSYTLEVVSFYGVAAHLYTLAAIYEMQAFSIEDNIQKRGILRVFGHDGKNITYAATKIISENK